jgi:mannose-6-phosphate isomerase-like protein (cupin superfamily)
MRIVQKPWGHEELLLEAESFTTKNLCIKQGHRLSKQFHPLKDEMMLVAEGVAQIVLQKPTGEYITSEIKKGDTVRVKPGTIHRVTAITDCVILETSVGDINSIIRLEDDYGRLG